MSIILETQNLGISFGGLVALKDLNLLLNEGEILGIVGPNGAGKTTVLNLITGVYRPTGGSLLFKGKRIDGLPPHVIASLGISRTFQNIRLIPSLSVLENVMLGRALRVSESPLASVILGPRARMERAAWVAYAEEMLDYVGLSDFSDVDATSLPYGKQRAVEIARAIATGADVILLDEPAAGMSSQEKQDLCGLIKDLRGNLKKTVVIIEHDVKMVLNLVDRVLVLDFGSQIAEGPPESIKVNPRVIEAYLGRVEAVPDAGN
ncbi:MAG: ABC transporter ATP-binding protein [Bacillota bacterium]